MDVRAPNRCRTWIFGFTLNDLYFLPGGNPDLKSEHGFTYDVGLSFSVGKENVYALSGGINWFDSHIDDWIIWLPTTKGFFSPRNLKKVHAYGAETNAHLDIMLGKDWTVSGIVKSMPRD